MDQGFSGERVVSFDLTLPAVKYGPELQSQFFESLIDKLRTLLFEIKPIDPATFSAVALLLDRRRAARILDSGAARGEDRSDPGVARAVTATSGPLKTRHPGAD